MQHGTSLRRARPGLIDLTPRELAQIAGVYVLLALAWQLGLARLFPQLSLDRLAEETVRFLSGPSFWVSLVTSFRRVAIGYTLALAVAIPVGLSLGLVPLLEDLLDPFIALIRPISPLGWLPFAVVWLKVSEEASIFLIAYAAFFPILLNTIQGVRDVPAVYREAALTLGARRPIIAWRVMLPAALPSILTGLRLGLGVAWSVIVAAELAIGFVLQVGIGYLMNNYTMFTFNVARIVILTLSVGVVGLLMDWGLHRLGDRITPWRAGHRAVE